MARYGIMLLVCMFCFAGCHCGQTNDGTQKKLKINDTSNPAYCEQFTWNKRYLNKVEASAFHDLGYTNQILTKQKRSLTCSC
uniref:Putative secreted protein n=1 Tax=Rhipicephalus microplus TaxID=6941 RepID=A0A6G5A2B9_RHIMP